jgi:hypothetical protein
MSMRAFSGVRWLMLWSTASSIAGHPGVQHVRGCSKFADRSQPSKILSERGSDQWTTRMHRREPRGPIGRPI